MTIQFISKICKINDVKIACFYYYVTESMVLALQKTV